MTTIQPSSLRAPSGDAATAAGTASKRTPNDPAGFASLLRQTHAAPAPMPMPMPTIALAAAPPPKPAAHESTPPDEATNDTEPPQASTDTVNRARALLKTKMRAVDDAKPTPTGTQPAAEAAPADASDAATDASSTAQPRAAPDPATLPIDPSVMHWLAGLQRAATEQTSDAAASTDTATDANAVTDNNPGSAADMRGTAKGLRAADLKADTELKDKAAQGKAQRAGAADAREFAGVLAEQRIGEKPMAPTTSAVARTNVDAATAAAAASAVMSAPIPGTEALAPAAVVITTPLDAPDFAQQLGLRLSVLAKDGVQTAELHLNPADMGPVSVQIVMDGTQARIDFGADMAATRQAIEAGLPELASALADAGFTLAGGGVSQHGGGHGGRGDSGTSGGTRQRHIGTDDDTKRVATAARRVVTQGGVDVFA